MRTNKIDALNINQQLRFYCGIFRNKIALQELINQKLNPLFFNNQSTVNNYRCQQLHCQLDYQLSTTEPSVFFKNHQNLRNPNDTGSMHLSFKLNNHLSEFQPAEQFLALTVPNK